MIHIFEGNADAPAMKVDPGSRPEAYIKAPFGDRKVEDRVQRSRTDAGQVKVLVERAQGGDRDAFGDVYRMCHGGVFRLVRFYLRGPEAEDAVAETFVRAWAALPRYRDTGAPFAAWLAGIARHVVADTFRGTKRVEYRSELPDLAGPDQHGAVDERMDLAAYVARLPKEQRQVIELKFLLGLTNDEVARALGRTPGAVNALQWRALQRLNRTMESS